MNTEECYIAIDLKSFYASAECIDRGLNPLTTNLVVADERRTEKTICLAASPSLKAYGIGGRPRLFEVVQRVKEVNRYRLSRLYGKPFSGKSADDTVVRQHKDVELDYIVAPPRMARYIETSTRIHEVYLKYVSPEDMHVYSIDEVFIYATPYLRTYGTTPREMALTIVRDILSTTGITATAGIGSNLYLSKIAMDIIAKHAPADDDGVRIAELTERTYREQLWSHRPLTDFWRVGKGTARTLEQNGIFTQGDLARMSLTNEDILYKLFGVNAELLIDHAWGWEPCTIKAIHDYKPAAHSLSNGQVLSEPYSFEKARVVAQEMADNMALHLMDKHLTTSRLTLTVNYDKENLTQPETASRYKGETTLNRYGLTVPKPTHGSVNLPPTALSQDLIKAITTLFDSVANPLLTVRYLNVSANNLASEDGKGFQGEPTQLNLFSDADCSGTRTPENREKETRLQKTILDIKQSFGKNAILKGLNFKEGATARERNRQIGGHQE